MEIWLYQLALKILDKPVPGNPVVEIVGLFIRQQCVHPVYGSYPVKQHTVFFQHIVLNIGLNVIFIVPCGKFLSIPFVDGLVHAVTNGLPGIGIDRIDIRVGNGQGLNQIALSFHLSVSSGNLTVGDPRRHRQQQKIFGIPPGGIHTQKAHAFPVYNKRSGHQAIRPQKFRHPAVFPVCGGR